MLKYRRAIIVTLQLLLVVIANHVACQLRFDADIPRWALNVHRSTLPWLVYVVGFLAFVFGVIPGGFWLAVALGRRLAGRVEPAAALRL